MGIVKGRGQQWEQQREGDGSGNSRAKRWEEQGQGDSSGNRRGRGQVREGDECMYAL